MLYKIITLFNWIAIAVIAVVAFLLIVEELSHKGGGDAAVQGMGKGILQLAIIALIVLLVLNLIPNHYGKYAAFAIVVVLTIFVLVLLVTPRWRDYQRIKRHAMEAAKPIFEDKTTEALARTFLEGDLEKWRTMQEKFPDEVKKGEFLAFAISESDNSNDKPDKQLACLQLLFDAGAKWDSVRTYELHFPAASSGKIALLRLLLEKGASANDIHHSFENHILFEALGAYKEPEATVKLLLEFGAKTDVTAVMNNEEGPVSPLFNAAKRERWGVCVVLLEHGADPNFKTSSGVTFRDIIKEADKNFTANPYGKMEDFERLKSLLK
ncbi:MAG: ankyrin repeat domain-containing protein [Saprospiraceae bacterium]|nr:ankyrin repeat domain-containing protein [Saprospiraceae bacterium]